MCIVFVSSNISDYPLSPAKLDWYKHSCRHVDHYSRGFYVFYDVNLCSCTTEDNCTRLSHWIVLIPSLKKLKHKYKDTLLHKIDIFNCAPSLEKLKYKAEKKDKDKDKYIDKYKDKYRDKYCQFELCSLSLSFAARLFHKTEIRQPINSTKFSCETTKKSQILFLSHFRNLIV